MFDFKKGRDLQLWISEVTCTIYIDTRIYKNKNKLNFNEHSLKVVCYCQWYYTSLSLHPAYKYSLRLSFFPIFSLTLYRYFDSENAAFSHQIISLILQGGHPHAGGQTAGPHPPPGRLHTQQDQQGGGPTHLPHQVSSNHYLNTQLLGSLKGQSNEIFDLQFFSSSL